MELGLTLTQDALALLITAAKPLYQNKVTHSMVPGAHDLGNTIQPSLSSDTKCLKSSSLGTVGSQLLYGQLFFLPPEMGPTPVEALL